MDIKTMNTKKDQVPQCDKTAVSKSLWVLKQNVL
jgi:hypothetical protein